MANKRGRPSKKEAEATIEEAETVEATTEEVPQEEPEPSVEKETASSTITPNYEGTSGGYNPFVENVVERDYSTPKVAEGHVGEIEEPVFTPPSYEDIINEREGETQGEGEQQEPMGSPFDQPNPALNDLDFQDKKIACESMVDTVLDGYEQLHKLAVHFAKVDEDSLMELQVKGKLDLEETIPVSEDGTEMSIAEFVGQYNQQCEEALAYDKDFGYKVRPAMIRVFMKKGWGMSDEQYLGYMFGKHAVTKITIMVSLKKTINNTLSLLQTTYKQNKAGGGVAQPIEAQDFYEEEPDEPEEQEAQPTIEIVEDVPKKKKKDVETQKFNIEYPQNPKDKMVEHPSEIQNELKKEAKSQLKKKRNKK